MSSKMLKENAIEIKGLVTQASKLLLGASLIFVVFCLFRGGMVIDLIYRESSADSALLLFLLSLAFLGMSSNLIYGSLLTANGSLKILNTISFLGLVLNFTLNLWFIPRATHGAVVAAAIAAVTQLFTAVAQAIYCKKLFQLEILHKGLWRYVLLVLFSGAWYLSIYMAFGDFTPKSTLLTVLLILLDLCFQVVLLFLLKFIDLNELIKLLQVRSKTQ
jgi:O-antigen/teichoic acid export membrane protein